MCEVQTKADISSGCRIDTQRPLEEYTITWNVTNFSKIFNIVSVEFSTASNATVWQLRLYGKYEIQLRRNFEGPDVRVNFACSLVTCDGTFQNKGTALAVVKDYYATIMDFTELQARESGTMNDMEERLREFPVFENDIFNFQCTLYIEGHSITNITESRDIELLNLKQLSLGFKELFRKKEHCDLTISVGHDNIQVHKAILCARSPVFDKMFQHDELEKESKRIEISDIDFDSLQEFLSFLYSGELKELCWEKAKRLYHLADKYEVKDLCTACSQILSIHMTVDNVCNALKLAEMYKDQELKRAAKYFIKIHSSTLQSTGDWKELIKTHPKVAADVLK